MDDPRVLTPVVDGRCQLCTAPCEGIFCSTEHWELWVAIRVLGGVARQMRQAAAALAPAFAQLGETMRGIRASLVEAGLVPEQAPSDPMAAALHARRHRNTGPTVHADPRRNRRPGR